MMKAGKLNEYNHHQRDNQTKQTNKYGLLLLLLLLYDQVSTKKKSDWIESLQQQQNHW